MTHWSAFRQAGRLLGTGRPVGGSMIPESAAVSAETPQSSPRVALTRPMDNFKLTTASAAMHEHYYYYHAITDLALINHLGKNHVWLCGHFR